VEKDDSQGIPKAGIIFAAVWKGKQAISNNQLAYDNRNWTDETMPDLWHPGE